MPKELFSNLGSTTVSSGGTTAPAAGTVETWTVASSSTFPAASNVANPPTQFRVQENDVTRQTEIILVTHVNGATWTVTRGAEGTVPVAHPGGFTIIQTITGGVMSNLSNTAGIFLETLVKNGNAAVGTNVVPPGVRVPVACTLHAAYLDVGTAPTGSSLSVAIVRGGTTLASVSCTAGSSSGSLTNVSIALAKGDMLTFDITAIGSTVAGANVLLTLEAH